MGNIQALLLNGGISRGGKRAEQHTRARAHAHSVTDAHTDRCSHKKELIDVFGVNTFFRHQFFFFVITGFESRAARARIPQLVLRISDRGVVSRSPPERSFNPPARQEARAVMLERRQTTRFF